MKRKTKAIILLIVVGFTLQLNAQQRAEKFVQETHYLLYLPDGFGNDTTQQWPLLIFLHGSGERGDDLEKVKVHGPPKLAAEGKKFPFVIVSPQAKPNSGWMPEQLFDLITDVKNKYHIDNDRVYLTGLSMGGFGTWELGMKHPELFAAIVPICGGGDTTEIWKLRYMPVWCFHGAKDNTVLLKSSQKMVNALKRYNPSVRFTIYPEANHDSWTVTYNNDSLYTWLLAQKKFKHKQVSIDEDLLTKYAGSYLSSENDTLRLVVEQKKLYVKLPERSIELKPASANLFFIDENSPEELLFTLDRKKAVDGFTFFANERVRFPKITTKK